MKDKKLKVFLFSYTYNGSNYSLEIPAYSIEEAKGRAARMAHASYDGELMETIPAMPGIGLWVRLSTLMRNLLRSA